MQSLPAQLQNLTPERRAEILDSTPARLIELAAYEAIEAFEDRPSESLKPLIEDNVVAYRMFLEGLKALDYTTARVTLARVKAALSSEKPAAEKLTAEPAHPRKKIGFKI